MYATLKKRLPGLKENFMVELVIDNLVQENEMKLEKPDLLGYLKKELDNTLITLETRMESENPGSFKPYTASDKFKKMADENPALIKLRQALELDIE